ncbi:MAG: hypothetical protein AAGI27_04330 [Pseudomonadota bacterium]
MERRILKDSSFLERIEDIQLVKPPSMSQAEFAELLVTLEDAKDRLRPYRGVFEADWLLSDFDAPYWKTKSLDSARVDGDWVNTMDVNWSIRLADGESLTDRRHTKTLTTLKKAAFLYRQGFAEGPVPTLDVWRAFVYDLFGLVRWLNFSGHCRSQLLMLNQWSLNQLTAELAKGGWSGAFQYPERIVATLYAATFARDCPQSIIDDPGNVPSNVRDAIIAHLEARSAYTVGGRRRDALSRKFLCELLNEPSRALSGISERTRAVIRQFEPRIADANGLLINTGNKRRYPSHRTITIETALARPTTGAAAKRLCGSVRILLSLSRHLPNGIPDPSTINTARSLRVRYPHSRPKGHTPMIPIETGLRYLNEAMKWVHQFGDAFLEFYLGVVTVVVNESQSHDMTQWDIERLHKRALQSTPMPAALSTAGFDLSVRHATVNKSGSVTQPGQLDITKVLQIWVGAIAVLCGMFKPSRDSEVTRYKRNCLIGEGPYWLDGKIAKTGVREHRDSSGGKPIPAIAARGIQQLQTLSAALVDLHDEKNPVQAERLFYLPKKGIGVGAVAVTNAGLDRYIDAFCDYVDMPLDSLGRRWYLRIHEMRKWFLLLLFWSGRYDVLDAARDIAGHSDVSDLYAYVEREFSSDDFYKLEAEYSVDRLRDYDYTRESHPEERGLVELYNLVLREFDVEQLELVPDRTWQSYVTALRQQDAFHLEPHSVSDENGNSRICISFRARADSALTL